MSWHEEPVYIDNLLAVRGLCALGVALVHCLGMSDLSLRWYLEHAWEFGESSRQALSAVWPSTGKNFVLFFFVHSGYLMGKIFFMERYALTRQGVWRFYRARVLRIVPLLYVNLILCLLLLSSAELTIIEAVGDFLLVTNFTGRNINSVTWSLSWEMQYYLIAPLVFACFRLPSYTTLIQIVALALLFELLAGFGIKEFPPTEFLFYFLIGFAVNVLLRRFDLRKFPGSVAIAIVVGFMLSNCVYYVLTNSGIEWLANPFVGIAAAFTIYMIELPGAEGDKAPSYRRYGTLRLLTLRFWTWIGMLSYGLYLWHLPILLVVGAFTVDLAQALVAGLGGVESGWQRVLIFHATQLPIVLGLTSLVSLITFFAVEVRFRPHLYRWDSSRFVLRHLTFLMPRQAGSRIA